MTVVVALSAACLIGVAAPAVLAAWERTLGPGPAAPISTPAPLGGAGRRDPSLTRAGRAGRTGRAVVVGAVAALLAAATVLRFGLTWLLPAHLWLALWAVVLSAVDLRWRRLPNVLVVPATVGLGALLAVAAAALPVGEALVRAGAAGIALFTLYLVMALVSPAGIGMGDVKLGLTVGAYTGFFGWKPVAVSVLVSFIAVAVATVALLMARRAGCGAAVPFGPAMFLGALVAVWPT